MKIAADFTYLDIKEGRHRLDSHFGKRPRIGPCPKELRIPVVIRGHIGRCVGHDDGISQLFEVEIASVETSPAAADPNCNRVLSFPKRVVA